ncbi:osm1, partial [Symbiodinium sp. KB8]
NVVLFRRSEVERLHRALQADGRSIAVLGNDVRHVPGFRTQPSQVRVKAVLLADSALQDDRDRIERGVERLMGTGITDPTIWRFFKSRNVFTAAADLCKYLSRNGSDREALVAALHTEDRSRFLQEFDEYKLFAEFSCSRCNRSWKSGLAWGVFDPRLQPNCTCLKQPLPGRERFTTPEHLRKNGCVHVFRDPEQCDEVQDLETHRDVLQEQPSVVLQRSRRWLRPRDDAGPPKQGCEVCSLMCDAIYCQATDRTLEKPHRADLCPKCKRTGRWCHGGIHKSDIVMRYALVASLLDSSVSFQRSEAGLQAEIEYDGHQVLLLLRPWLYIIPEHRDAFTTTGQEEAVLRPDRQPAGASEQSMFRRALQMVMSDKADMLRWPPPLSVAETMTALRAFADQSAARQPTDAEAAAVEAALAQRDPSAALQQALDFLQVPRDVNDSRPSVADQFKVFLKGLRQGAAASSSHEEHLPAATGPAVRAAPRDHSQVAQAFAMASQCMGGRLDGPWRCFRMDEKRDYGQRHGQTYWKPHGWVKRRLRVDDYETCRTWPIAYHGTSAENAPKILLTNLRKPGQGGATQQHGGAGASASGTIYVTPSIYYAAHPVYAPLHEDDERDVVVIGLMYRELGSEADASIYGSLATRLRQEGARKGVEFKWTEILAEHHRSRGLLVGQS